MGKRGTGLLPPVVAEPTGGQDRKGGPRTDRSPGSQTERQLRGAQAEQAALEHLMQRGLRLVARNVRYRAGELDLVMRDGPTLVFVEVRARARPGWGGAAASVDTGKQHRLIRAAQLYLQTVYGNCPPPCRFDVMVLDGDRIEWLRDAFSG